MFENAASCTLYILDTLPKMESIIILKVKEGNPDSTFHKCFMCLNFNHLYSCFMHIHISSSGNISCYFKSFVLCFNNHVVVPLFSTVVLESQEATIVYLPYLIAVQTIIDQIAVAGFKALVKSKPRPLQLSPSEMERFVDSQKPTISSPSETLEETEVFVDTTLVMLRVKGMHCRSCVVNIQDNISLLPGVSSVEVFLEKEKASICYDPLQVTVTQLQQAIEALPPGNFTAQPWESSGLLSPVSTSPMPALPSPRPSVAIQAKPAASQPCFNQPLASVVNIHIEGMTCNSCVQSIEGMISQREGVTSAQVSLSDHQGIFEYDSLLTTPEKLREAIEDMGFDAFLPGERTARVILDQSANYSYRGIVAMT